MNTANTKNSAPNDPALCFKCGKQLEVLFEETNQFHSAVEFIGRGAYGSGWDMQEFKLQICDECLKNIPNSPVLEPYQQRKVSCSECDAVIAEFETRYLQTFCGVACRETWDAEFLEAINRELDDDFEFEPFPTT